MPYCYFLVIICLLFSACRSNFIERQTQNMIPYNDNEFFYELLTENSKAAKPQVGEQVNIDFKLQKGLKILDDSYFSVYPTLVQIPEKKFDNFFTRALKLMSQGDSLRVLIRAGNIPELLGEFASEFKDKELVTFNFKMNEIVDIVTLEKQILREQVLIDSIRNAIPQLISQFNTSELEYIQKTEDGISYILFHEGTGVDAKDGDEVSIHYICFSQTGIVVDDSYSNMVPLTFQIGSPALIEGCSEAAKLLRQGGKALVFIPPELAYGSQGNGVLVPPDSYVVFYIEMMEVD